MADFPQKSRDSLAPEKYSNPKKKMGDVFNEAMNAPNDPRKRYQPDEYNVTDCYTSGDNSDSDKEPDNDSDDYNERETETEDDD
jgi:hypothetical protein